MVLKQLLQKRAISIFHLKRYQGCSLTTLRTNIGFVAMLVNIILFDKLTNSDCMVP